MKLFRRGVLVAACLVIQPWFLAFPAYCDSSSLPVSVAQTAEIIGIRQEAEEIASLRRVGALSAVERRRFSVRRALALRKIFEAVLQLRAAENRLEFELDYAYDVLAREQHRNNTVNQLFNVANFAQLSTLYGFFEPYSRLNEKFKQSAIGTSVGSGLAIALPLLNIIYNKTTKVSNLSPPKFLSAFIDGSPVDGRQLPPVVARYLDSPVPGGSSTKTRREILGALWQERYHADMSKVETLAGIDDGKSKKSFILNTRIVLLWSLRTAIQGLNRDLLALLNEIRGAQFETVKELSRGRISALGLSGGADEAARLLQIEPVVSELKNLKGSLEDLERKQELQLSLLEAILSGYLDLRVASDRCQQELNYQYDVVLAQMTARRGRFLQKTYEANFIQTGTFGACAGWSYLNNYPKAGNQLFIISDAIGLSLTTVSLLGTHGGWRRNHSEPNSLADFFDLRASGNQGFSPLVWNYLNSSSPRRGDGKSRRQFLQELWDKRGVATISLKKTGSLDKLASMPSCKWDTIKLVNNRIALLSSLQEQFWQFDEELLDLLRKTWPESNLVCGAGESNLGLSANAAADLLGVRGLMAGAEPALLDDRAKLLITRRVLEGFLDASANSNLIGHEILIESQILAKMNREKDRAIQFTNLANFYQLGILGIVSDSMGLSSNSKYVLYADRINIVSGYLIASLALASVLEGHGGFRSGKVQPNLLGSAFGKSTASARLSPLMLRYLNEVSPISQTQRSRREELVNYWREAKILNVDIRKDSVVERLSAEGKAHHWWSETTKLISNRITMLYDLRATLNSSNVGFDELLKSLD